MAVRLLSIGFLMGVQLAGRAFAQDTLVNTESTFLSNVRQLTIEGLRAGEGYFSRDGKQMVFQSEREPGNPFYQIYEGAALLAGARTAFANSDPARNFAVRWDDIDEATWARTQLM